LIEVTVRAGEGSPWHVHPDEDEWFYVLAGEFTAYVGDEGLSLPAGSFAFGPKGVPHTFIAETDGAKALIGFQPFLFEGFLHEVGEPATERVLPPPLEVPPDMARLIPIGSRNGIEILGPPGPPPGRDVIRAAPAPRRARGRSIACLGRRGSRRVCSTRARAHTWTRRAMVWGFKRSAS